ncbi:sensor histidine kinase [Piscinibacter sakaiensis]|uniref:histidine kinase n=1 Tax=Piscinibacter sakaiensis TaxID=1547922 RepID=A0A0K8P876_PISS1|nr:ATP-binding protein [Piscinibacter sakaiensis]GAP38841.1 signal transduction histidine kinase HoxJ [Piscinibacter sakaiensis]
MVSSPLRPSLPLPPPEGLEGVDESTWVDVIQKMDEVYSQLVADEVALEAKNAQLEQTQQFLFSLLSSMSDVLVACNERGQIEETNAALGELVGRPEAALRGSSVYELLADPAQAERLRRLVEPRDAGQGGEVLELALRDAAGQPVPVDLNCTPRRNARGRRVGLVMVGRPLGELKRAYHQLREAHEALKRTQQQLLHSEKMASLGRLVAGVAHELNNPISFVLGNVHALKRYSERLARYVACLHDGGDAADAAALRRSLRIDHLLADLPSLIEGTLEGAQRTADIVQGLKRFSAVDREERLPVDLHGVVERAIHWVRKGTAPEFQVEWSPGPRGEVLGNAGQLMQVVMNLVQNAYDATTAPGPDGRPAAAAPALWISGRRDGDGLALDFRDNGPGIPEAHLSRLFDPFFTTKPVGKGTGLGLSISYGIVQQHGGRLSAAQAPQGGALFTLWLPLLRGPEAGT